MTASQQASGGTTTARSTVVGVFPSRSQAERAIDDLKRAGFGDDQIGFAMRGADADARAAGITGTGEHTGSAAATGAIAGGVLGGILGALAALVIPGVGPILAGGILVSALGGAAIGATAGGLLGALTQMGVPEEEARYYDSEFQAGRAVVTVRAGDRARKARDILRRYEASFAPGAAYAGTDTTSASAPASTPAIAGTATRATTGTTAGAVAGATSGAARTVEREGTVRVPEVEERLDVQKRPVQRGQVQIHKEVTEEQKTVPVDLTREEVHVERRDVPERPVSTEDAFQEGTIQVPVRGEEAVVRKEAVVTGEVVVNKARTTEHQDVQDTVRRTEVHVDNPSETVRPAGQETVSAGSSGYTGTERWEDVAPRFRSRWQQQYGASGGRWEDDEPGYRYGWEMRNDARYRGRDFDEVEGDLERDWAIRHPATPWQKVRAYVRETWLDVKSAV